MENTKHPCEQCSIPPPEPTLIEKIKKTNHEMMETMFTSHLGMGDSMVYNLNNQVATLNNKIAKLNKTIHNLQAKSKEDHDACDEEYNNLEQQLFETQDENESLKQEKHLSPPSRRHQHLHASHFLNFPHLL